MFTRLIGTSAAVTLALPGVALAHGGHLGELAGHSHWIGVAALAGAALIGGLVAAKSKKARDKNDAADKSGEEIEPETEAAT